MVITMADDRVVECIFCMNCSYHVCILVHTFCIQFTHSMPLGTIYTVYGLELESIKEKDLGVNISSNLMRFGQCMQEYSKMSQALAGLSSHMH